MNKTNYRDMFTKLNKIMLALLALLTLATSCSKDDDSPKLAKGEALLSVQVQPKTAATKASSDPNELEGEAYVNNLAILIFTADGSSVIGRQWSAMSAASTASTFTISNVETKSVKAEFVVVANTPQGTFDDVTNFTQFQAKLTTLAANAQTNLVMSTQLIQTETALVSDDNYVGFSSVTNNINGLNTPLLLTRVVARVELDGVYTAFNGDNVGRTVTIDEAYVTNIKTSAYCFSVADWGVVENATSEYVTTTPVQPNISVNNETPYEKNVFRYYAMENTNTKGATAIILKATIQANTKYQAQTKYFTAVVNDTQKTGVNHLYVKRNYVYKVLITFTDKAFDLIPIDNPTPPTPTPDPVPDPTPTPDPTPRITTANLYVAVTVAPWSVVTQTPIIK